MLATMLQLAALAGLPVGGALMQGVGGGIVGGAVSALLLGQALEANRPSG